MKKLLAATTLGLLLTTSVFAESPRSEGDVPESVSLSSQIEILQAQVAKLLSLHK